MNATLVLIILAAPPVARAVDSDGFAQMDAQVAAEAKRVSSEARAAQREQERQLARMRATRSYWKIIPVQIRPMQGESLSRAYVEACLGLRPCPGPTAFFVEWMLTHEADGFERILEWTRAHGAKGAVPDQAVRPVVSFEQALQLADASPADVDWLLAARLTARLDAQQARMLFTRLLEFDRKAPGSLVYALSGLDPEGTCRYLQEHVPKAKRAGLPIHCVKD